MTKLRSEKTLRRETGCTDRRRAVVVELYPFYCGVRVKGTREFYAVPWDAVLDLGRKMDARGRELERKRA